MKLFSLTTLLVAALFSVVVTIPFLPLVASKTGQFEFDVTLTSTASGKTQIYYDLGKGLSEANSTSVSIAAGKPQRVHLALPIGTIQGLRFDPINHEATLTLADPVISMSDGHVVQKVAL